MHNIDVYPLSAERIKSYSYDAFVASCGFESRARYIAESRKINAKNKVACCFGYNQELSYQDNYNWFESNEFDLPMIEEEKGYDRWFKENILERAINKESEVRILVDISSMSRRRIAHIVSCISNYESQKDIVVDFIYSLASYTSPSSSLGPVIETCPVTPDFAGWPGDPALPLSCIVGLGYNEGKAIGAMEYLEPGELWAFLPIGEDDRFRERVLTANRFLIASLPEERKIEYNIKDVYYLYRNLSSLVASMEGMSRPVMLPFGPKIFSLCCMLVAVQHQHGVSVWRSSADRYEDPVDVKAKGVIMGISIKKNRVTGLQCG